MGVTKSSRHLCHFDNIKQYYRINVRYDEITLYRIISDTHPIYINFLQQIYATTIYDSDISNLQYLRIAAVEFRLNSIIKLPNVLLRDSDSGSNLKIVVGYYCCGSGYNVCKGVAVQKIKYRHV